MKPDTCRLHAALGVYEECPGGWCAFWDHGRCVIEELGLNVGDEAALAAYLLDVRRDLEAGRDTTIPEELLPPGLAGS